MRFVFLIPDLDTTQAWKSFGKILERPQMRWLLNFVKHNYLRTGVAFGGTLNIMRHCQVARNCGVEAVMATMSGRDTYGEKGIPGLPYIRWKDRRPDDICIVPDFVSELINQIQGPVIAYLQVPIHTHANFDYQDSRVTLWTDSPYMKEICASTYVGKEIHIVPNIVDNQAFPFIPQSEREAGLLFAFPRKGPEFIAATEEYYRKLGGTYWRFERVDGLPFYELAQQFRRPQAFLASAEMEGCALPPQESMAAGIVVVGKTARGANFCMEHGQTAMTAETPEEAAQCLIQLEDAALRESIARNAHAAISVYFPSEEPTRFWQNVIQQYGGTTTVPVPTLSTT